jgi:hypothetical protein
MIQVAGFRCSYYGSQGGHGRDQLDSTPDYWVCVAQQEAAKFQNSKPGGIYVLGGIGTSETNMPFANPGVNIPYVVYDTGGGWGPDPEPFLTAFDQAGMEVILQVEPGMADISQLSTMILTNFGHHSCVKGFGVDVEWWQSHGNSNTTPMPASVANSLVSAVHAINPAYKVILKHYDSTVLPKGIAGVTYLIDGCGYNSLSEAVSDYITWAQNFSGSEIGYQTLYIAIGNDCLPNDHAWWKNLINPEVQLINGVLAQVPTANIYCTYIVDFSLGYVYPTCTISPPQYPNPICQFDAS